MALSTLRMGHLQNRTVSAPSLSSAESLASGENSRCGVVHRRAGIAPQHPYHGNLERGRASTIPPPPRVWATGVVTDLTLDGPGHIHDKRRIGPEHRQTFDTIAANIELALARNSPFTSDCASTSIPRTQTISRSFHKTFVERGWEQHPNFTANAATVQGAWLRQANRNLISNTKLVELTARLRKTRRSQIASYELVARRTLSNCIQGNGCAFNSTALCAAETGMLDFRSAWTCTLGWEEIGHPNQRIGTYSDKGIDFSREALGQWLRAFPERSKNAQTVPTRLFINRAAHTRRARQATRCSRLPALLPRLFPDDARGCVR